MTTPPSKLKLAQDRVTISATHAETVLNDILVASGCSQDVAENVAKHLVDSSLCGVESHGVMRILQYSDQMQSGYLKPKGLIQTKILPTGAHEIDGGGQLGIPAMHLATQTVCDAAQDAGIAAVAVRNVGHTGRLGAFAELAAERGCMMFMVGGGNREQWRQVAPYGGKKAMLGTNPFCMGVPGGERGPVVLDFATSKVAGGWLYAARSAGAELPEGCVIDKEGQPTCDPEDYFEGGAILPAAGPKGYAMAVMAEMICEAMLGPVETECNWLILALDAGQFRAPTELQAKAEEILSELRNCPPADGFDRVEIPGEREADQRLRSAGKIAIPARTWEQIKSLAKKLGVEHD